MEVHGNRLRELRLGALMSQRELAGRAGVAVETISRIETSEVRNISDLTTRKITRALGVKIEDLTS
jgi:transcriptional regulator with XRE-family HTH domain